MNLSLLACVAENNSILEELPEEVKVYWRALIADKPVVVTESWTYGTEMFVGSRVFVVTTTDRVVEETLVKVASWAEALEQLTEEEEVFIATGPQEKELFEKADRLYLFRFHREEVYGKWVLPVSRKEWCEVSRRLVWDPSHGNYSTIVYQRKALDLPVSVIISTCNQSEWLEKTLWGYEAQTEHCFELIIADDGSRKETYDRIESILPRLSYPVKHVWHEDKGFRKCDILNKAILASGTEYLLFSDGDCIPRKDFVATHLKYREPGRFLSGGYHKLGKELSESITCEDILSGQCFDIHWLKARGMKSSFKNNKLTSFGWKARLLNAVTPTKPTWNGHNASGWLQDILATNGFDERMQYGGQDREFGERLENSGIHGKQIRYSAVCLHLDHARGYKTAESIQKNLTIRKETRQKKVKHTPYGIVKDHNEEVIL